jgi:protein ImuA
MRLREEIMLNVQQPTGLFSPARSSSASTDFPGVWRANELAVSRTATYPSGFDVFDNELPGRGWPRSALIELLLQQSGVGEMQLLKPVLAGLSRMQKIVLVQPPHLPQVMACKNWGVRVDNLVWIKTSSTADGLWATEQILKNGSCGAVILWQANVRSESLRRLHLAAQSTDTWLWLMRPLAAQMDASPAQLRIALRPAAGGVALNIVKRRGPNAPQLLFIPLADMPVSRYSFRHSSDQENASVVMRTRPAVTARSDTSLLV